MKDIECIAEDMECIVEDMECIVKDIECIAEDMECKAWRWTCQIQDSCIFEGIIGACTHICILYTILQVSYFESED